MRALLIILTIMVVLACVFFILNYDSLDKIYLDNGIGSYSLIYVDLYDKTSIENPNISAVVYPSDWIGTYNPVFYLNEYSLREDSIDLAEYITVGPLGALSNIDGRYSLIIKISAYGLELPKEFASNVPMTPQRFHELYPNGYDMTISSAKIYKIIQGNLNDEYYNHAENLRVRCYCAPVINTDGSIDNSKYLVTFIPYEYLYRYNLLDSLQTVSTDLNVIKNSVPNLSDIFDSTNIIDIVRDIARILCYPLELGNFVLTSIEIIVNDLTGVVVVNKFGYLL